jgi:hypothetical protein
MSMLDGIKALFFFIKMQSENARMKNYFRSIADPSLYFEGKCEVLDSENPHAVWYLRELKTGRIFNMDVSEINEKFLACSPYEAISSIS